MKQQSKPKTPAELAREAAGLTRAELAKKATLSEVYIKKIERHGRASFTLAERLVVLCHAVSKPLSEDTEASPRPSMRQHAGPSLFLRRAKLHRWANYPDASASGRDRHSECTG